MEITTAAQYRDFLIERAKNNIAPDRGAIKLFNILEGAIYNKGMSILDVACGPGHYYTLLQSLEGVRYTGIDIDPLFIEAANAVWAKEENVKFFVHDIRLPFKDQKYDIVFCFNTIRHILDYKKVLSNLFVLSGRYLIIRSFFGDKEIIEEKKMLKGYNDVYSGATMPYITLPAKEVVNLFLEAEECRFVYLNDEPNSSFDLSLGLKHMRRTLNTPVRGRHILVVEKEK